MLNTDFFNNKVFLSGGGMSVWYKVEMIIAYSNFILNSAALNGGGVDIQVSESYDRRLYGNFQIIPTHS